MKIQSLLNIQQAEETAFVDYVYVQSGNYHNRFESIKKISYTGKHSMASYLIGIDFGTGNIAYLQTFTGGMVGGAARAKHYYARGSATKKYFIENAQQISIRLTSALSAAGRWGRVLPILSITSPACQSVLSRISSTAGGPAICSVPNVQSLMDYICNNGFERHVAMRRGLNAKVLMDACGKYMGWDVYWHR